MNRLTLVVSIVLFFGSTLASNAQDKGNWRLYRSKKESKQQEPKKVEQTTPTEQAPYTIVQPTEQVTIGIVNIHEDYRLAKLEERFKQEHADGKINGYRVQIFFGDREKAREIKTNFLKKYPTTKADVTYLAPNFRVRVGHFRTQLEAEKFKHEIKGMFPGCYIVPEKIPLPKL